MPSLETVRQDTVTALEDGPGKVHATGRDQSLRERSVERPRESPRESHGENLGESPEGGAIEGLQAFSDALGELLAEVAAMEQELKLIVDTLSHIDDNPSPAPDDSRLADCLERLPRRL